MCAFSKTSAKKGRANMKGKESSVVEVMAWGIFCPASGQFVDVQDLVDYYSYAYECVDGGGRERPCRACHCNCQ